MLVKMLLGAAGPEFNHRAGKVYDLPEDEASRYIEAGSAIPVTRDGKKIIETAESRAGGKAKADVHAGGKAKAEAK